MKFKSPAQNKKAVKLEKQIAALKKKLGREYKKAKPVQIDDYEVIAGGVKKRLSELFGEHSEMLLIHNMGLDCAYCTLWADGFNGFAAYYKKRCALVLENDESPAALTQFASKRGWKFPVVSSEGSSLKVDLGFKVKDSYAPGISSLKKDKKGRIFQVNATILGPGDNFCSIFDLLSLLPKGVGEFAPNYDL